MKIYTRRAVSLILIIALALTLTPALQLPTLASTSGTCGDNLTWTLDDAGLLTISGTGSMWDYTSLTSNYAQWCSDRGSIKSLSIEDGVTTIGNYAFWHCTPLSKLTIPNDITSIGSYAFSGCISLVTLVLQNGTLFSPPNKQIRADVPFVLYSQNS
jgi:hypothetical protein